MRSSRAERRTTSSRGRRSFDGELTDRTPGERLRRFGPAHSVAPTAARKPALRAGRWRRLRSGRVPGSQAAGWPRLGRARRLRFDQGERRGHPFEFGLEPQQCRPAGGTQGHGELAREQLRPWIPTPPVRRHAQRPGRCSGSGRHREARRRQAQRPPPRREQARRPAGAGAGAGTAAKSRRAQLARSRRPRGDPPVLGRWRARPGPCDPALTRARDQFRPCYVGRARLLRTSARRRGRMSLARDASRGGSSTGVGAFRHLGR